MSELRGFKKLQESVKQSWISWILFICLSVIWGSSFILMKEGMRSLNAWQVASLRIISSGLVLLPVAFRNLKHLSWNRIGLIFLSGILGSLLPAYLFCIAEQGIDSSLAGVLNSLTPIFVIVVGALFFSMKVSLTKIVGIIVAFTGSVLLFFAQPNYAENSHLNYVLYVVLATVMYGVNVNLVSRYLNNIPSVQIAAIALSLNSIPAFVVLYFTGFFQLDLSEQDILVSTMYSAILGVFGTALASILFYKLIKKAGAVFSSMVTYCIPVVAISWGLVYGEEIGWLQLACLVIILTGVFIANRRVA